MHRHFLCQVRKLSENLKLRIGLGTTDDKSDPALPNDLGPIDEAESQMRKALGLLGEAPRHRPDPERLEAPVRTASFSGGLHRRRFVQDGDVPVTVVRRDQGHEALPHRAPTPSSQPNSNRLQRAEAALAAETQAREKAERQLAEAHSIVRDLQTKIGHAELAKVEALEALRQEREAAAHYPSEVESLRAQLHELRDQLQAAEKAAAEYQDQIGEELRARKQLEKALKATEAARDAAEHLVQTLSVEAPVEPERKAPAETQRRPRGDVSAASRQRVVEAEPEPVKWWLNAKVPTKRR